MNRAFVLGNGTSRQIFNCESLKKYGKVYGCNAIYRDFLPDYLVAVDPKMIYELNEKGVQHQVPTYTNFNQRYKEFQGFNILQPSKGWSSGPTALWLASTHRYDEIYILGFDYVGLQGGKYVNNLYAGTHNYKQTNAPATFYGNWLRQTEQVLKDYEQIKYYRVGDTEGYDPGWKKNNFKNINYFEFRERINYQN